MEGHRRGDRDVLDPARSDRRARDGLAARLGPGPLRRAGGSGARRRALVGLCATLVSLPLLTATGCAREPAPAAAPTIGATEQVVVRRVGDGDSLSLADGRKLRLVQIDVP